MRPALRDELLRRLERDQAARRAMDMEAWEAADAENLPWLKQVVAEAGWPGSSMAGEDGAHAAWLLVQHADRDPVFQRRCLDLLIVAADQGEATHREVAYLTDRVLLAEGKQQEFGTQARGWKGQYVARELRDPDGVDERRVRMGLGPLDAYLAQMKDTLGPPAPAQMRCSHCGGTIEFWLPGESESVSVTCPGCGQAVTLSASASGAEG